MKLVQPFTHASSRRFFLLQGLGGAAALTAAAQQLSNQQTPRIADPACVLSSEQEEGPYYLDLHMMRKNITENKPGVPLRLRIAVVDSATCKPLPNAALDIWHCDATGLYSGFTAMTPPDGGDGRGRGPGRGPDFGGGQGFGPPPDMPPGQGFNPDGRGPGGPGGPGRGRGASDKFTFLRGIQITDRNGIVEFDTIYPGWYVGRGLHIHTKVHLGGEAGEAKYAGGHVAHTGQLFLSDDITESVAKLDPYVTHKARRTLLNADGIYRSQHGSEGLLTLAQLEKRSMAAGFQGTVTLAVNPSATPSPAGRGGPGRGPGGPRGGR